ncbi:hypothetical protein, partial [Klebsiella pneumoniae]|uniref:hypothetical protein n=1 Tax=Klebsiella pneumoniae TaxID=573 RepID=UPI001C9BBC43
MDREIYPLKPFSSSALYRQTLRKGHGDIIFRPGRSSGKYCRSLMSLPVRSDTFNDPASYDSHPF